MLRSWGSWVRFRAWCIRSRFTRDYSAARERLRFNLSKLGAEGSYSVRVCDYWVYVVDRFCADGSDERPILLTCGGPEQPLLIDSPVRGVSASQAKRFLDWIAPRVPYRLELVSKQTTDSSKCQTVHGLPESDLVFKQALCDVAVDLDLPLYRSRNRQLARDRALERLRNRNPETTAWEHFRGRYSTMSNLVWDGDGDHPCKIISECSRRASALRRDLCERGLEGLAPCLQDIEESAYDAPGLSLLRAYLLVAHLALAEIHLRMRIAGVEALVLRSYFSYCCLVQAKLEIGCGVDLRVALPSRKGVE